MHTIEVGPLRVNRMNIRVFIMTEFKLGKTIGMEFYGSDGD